MAITAVCLSRRRQRLMAGCAAPRLCFCCTAGAASRWHREDADELWCFYEGAPLELLIAEQLDQPVQHERLGPVAAEKMPQRAVLAHAWQAARSLGDFTLVGCTVAPGFDFAGFSLLRDEPQAQHEWPLLRSYPELL